MEIGLERQMKCWFTNSNWIEIDLAFEIYKRPIGVIITKVIKETGIRLWIYSLSKPKTTLITIRGVMIQNEVVGMMYVLTEERERWWIALTLVSNWKWLKQELCRANGGLATSSGHTSSNYLYLLSIGAPLILGVLFHGVAGAAALRSHQSGSGER